MKLLREILVANRRGQHKGVYSVCSAHPFVIEAALEQVQADDGVALIESTANQVNQYGGYTGMAPEAFVAFVHGIAARVGVSKDRIILGGDHLGPVCWTDETASEAMSKSEELVKSYIRAGFKKIHLDTSMPCADDAELDDVTIARRAAQLCKAAEETAISCFGGSDISYIIGTEVPPPGGATEALQSLKVTSAQDAISTIQIHQKSFGQLDLHDAWQRVVGLVVQPGVEFGHTNVVDYSPQKALQLISSLNDYPNMVFEAHSTDYQPPGAYKSLVEDHFAILKVGPQLTFAMREALFALSYIEDEIVNIEDRSFLRLVCEQEMQESPGGWKKYYDVPFSKEQVYRRYSYSDRIRYYWTNPRIARSVEKLMQNLEGVEIPLPLLSQFMPTQYQRFRDQPTELSAKKLVIGKIMEVTKVYSDACRTIG